MPSGSVGKPGLGTSIVRALATQLKATVSALENSPGAMVVVEHDERVSALTDRSAPIPLLV
jgi:two-component sensor histidine kinase